MAKSVTSILHEFNSRNQHRIVTVANGVPQYGAWYELRDIASFKNLRANTNVALPLPVGVFTCTARDAAELGG